MKSLLCPEPQNFSAAGLDFASKHFDVTAKAMDQSEFDQSAPGYDSVMVRFNTRVGLSALATGSRVRMILSPTTGLDHIDLDLAKKNRVKVFHLRGQRRFLRDVSSTAELAVGLILALLRKLPAAHQSVLAGNWQPVRGHEAAGKTLGIVGHGRLGRKVAMAGRALGMNILVHDVVAQRLPSSMAAIGSLDELLSRSDIVTLHVPLDDKTHGMIGAEQLRLFKHGALLINTARGALIDSAALLRALEEGSLAGAALDVLDNEHGVVRDGHPLIEYARRHDNLIVTPHMGGSTFEAVEKTDLFILQRAVKSLRLS